MKFLGGGFNQTLSIYVVVLQKQKSFRLFQNIFFVIFIFICLVGMKLISLRQGTKKLNLKFRSRSSYQDKQAWSPSKQAAKCLNFSLTSTNRQHLQLMTTYNNSLCQAHLLADLLTIPLMCNLVLWSNFQKIYI